MTILYDILFSTTIIENNNENILLQPIFILSLSSFHVRWQTFRKKYVTSKIINKVYYIDAAFGF